MKLLALVSLNLMWTFLVTSWKLEDKFDVVPALRYLAQAAFTKALVRGTEGSMKSDDFLLLSSHEDEKDCVKKLICEIQKKELDTLQWDLKLIRELIPTTLSLQSPYVQFMLAAEIGKKVGGRQCLDAFSRCAMGFEEMVRLLRIRGASLDIEAEDETTCSIIFLWKVKPEASNALGLAATKH